MDDCVELLDIARDAARNIQRRYDLDWTPDDYDDAAGWALVELVEAKAHVRVRDITRRYAPPTRRASVPTRAMAARGAHADETSACCR
jgi:non-homologous end joining protein Ku